MNVKEITPGTNGTMFATFVPLTVVTIWVVVTVQVKKIQKKSLCGVD